MPNASVPEEGEIIIYPYPWWTPVNWNTFWLIFFYGFFFLTAKSRYPLFAEVSGYAALGFAAVLLVRLVHRDRKHRSKGITVTYSHIAAICDAYYKRGYGDGFKDGVSEKLEATDRS